MGRSRLGGGSGCSFRNGFLQSCRDRPHEPDSGNPRHGVQQRRIAHGDSVEFHLSHGDWIRLLRRSGFEIEDLVELRPQAGATTAYPYVTLEWARKWPSEEVWKARRR